MTDYSELVKALRICGKGSCVDCDRQRQDKCLKRHWNNEYMIDGMLCEAAAAIEDLQAQLPKRGEWIHGREIGKEWAYDHWIIYYEDWHCSNCKVVFEQDEKPKYNYCPNCGAKMEVQE